MDNSLHLKDVDQFDILNINGATSFLLQFGTVRTVLDVDAKREAVLYLTTQELELVPIRTEKAEFAEGHWHEMYLSNGVELWLSHLPSAPISIAVVGFIPAKTLRYSTRDILEVHFENRTELGEGIVEPHLTPVWFEPSEAWFAPRLEAKQRKHSEVVVQNSRGQLAIIGTIRAQAFFY